MNRRSGVTRVARHGLQAWAVCLATLLCAGVAPAAEKGKGRLRLEEATISSVHEAIRAGDLTCQGLVEAYIERAKAYNGMCTALVTADGKPTAPARGAMRVGIPNAGQLNARDGARSPVRPQP
jgi:amidase